MLVDTSPAIVPAMRWSPTGAEALAEAIVHASLPPPLRALIEAKHSIGGSAYSREAFRGCDRRWAPSWRSFGLELGRLASIRIHNSLYLVSLPTPGLPNCTLAATQQLHIALHVLRPSRPRCARFFQSKG